MTQALNLANFANTLNSSGQTSNSGLQNSSIGVSAGTGISVSNTTPALGASTTITNTGVTSLTAGTGIAISSSTGGITITNTISGIGYSQHWQNVTSSRALSNNYTNSTGKPIQVNAWCYRSGGSVINMDISLVCDGIQVDYQGIYIGSGTGGNWACNVSAIIPIGSTYSISANYYDNYVWTELR
jgi:hypothetical protein